MTNREREKEEERREKRGREDSRIVTVGGFKQGRGRAERGHMEREPLGPGQGVGNTGPQGLVDRAVGHGILRL